MSNDVEYKDIPTPEQYQLFLILRRSDGNHLMNKSGAMHGKF